MISMYLTEKGRAEVGDMSVPMLTDDGECPVPQTEPQ
jgi:hypothetical protein